MAPVIKEADDFKRRFGVEIAVGLGQTEASCPIVAPYGRSRPGGSGWCRPDYEIRVVDEHDAEVAPGETGELLVRSREPWSTMLRYNQMPEATVEKFRNLWLHTGDLVRQADGGHVYFVDRGGDRIRRRGENVSSFEVESEIRRHPAVLEAAVVAVPRHHTADDMQACVRLTGEHDVAERELYEFLAERLPYFMVPRYIELVDDFEKTPTQRIVKSILREAGVTSGTWDAA